MLAFLDYHRPIDVDLFKACYPWSVLDFHVGEIHVVPNHSQFYLVALLILIIFAPHPTQKASVGMYSGCDYLFPTNLVCILFGIAIPTSSFNFIQLFFLFFFYCF